MLRTLVLVVAVGLTAGGKGKASRQRPPPPAPPPPPTSPMPRVQQHLNTSVQAALASATQVQAYRVATSGGLRPDPAKAIGSDFVRLAAGKVLAPEELKRLRAILYDDKSYRFTADVAGCDFQPEVSFQVSSGLDTVEALVSFKCNALLFYLGKPGGRWLPAGTFDVKPARKALLELARATLPGEAAVQQLK